DDELLELLGDPLDKLTAIAAISPQSLEPFEQDGGQGLEQLDSGFAIIHIRHRDHHFEQNTERIDQDVAFTTLDHLAPIEAPFPTHCRRLDTLAINGGGTRLRFPACL